jgi:signal transduction histidine kinase
MELREELRETTNLIDQIFEQVPVNLYVKDEDGRHRWMSNAHRDPEAVIGKTDREFYDDGFGEQTYADDMAVIETGEPTLDVEEYNPNEDSWTLTSKTPWYGDDGEVQGLIGVTLDISERMEYKGQLERQNERLERFANVVSHDLRNPLNVATGYLELIAEECDSEHIDRVDAALERIEHIVDDVLTMAREGQTVEEPESVSLSTLGRESWRNVETGAADLEIEGDVEFEADPVRIQSILENLFRNAVEHGPADVTVHRLPR